MKTNNKFNSYLLSCKFKSSRYISSNQKRMCGHKSENQIGLLEKVSPALLTIKQICKLLNISRTEFYRLKNNGKYAPKSIDLCRKVLYRRDEIESWIQAGLPNREQWNKIIENNKIKTNFSIQNFKYVLGNVQTEYVEMATNSNLENYPYSIKNNKSFYKKMIDTIFSIVVFIAALFTCLYYLDWLEPVKIFFYIY